MGKHETPEVRRAQILEAARRCFGEAGYHKTKMDDIVSRAGLSKGALYWHFESKDEIFLALFDLFEQAIFAGWDALPPQRADLALRREGEIALSTMLHDRGLVEIVRKHALRATPLLNYGWEITDLPDDDDPRVRWREPLASSEPE